MKKYQTYSAIDFTHDDHFMKWVKSPGQSRQRDRFWSEWTARHPEKAKEVEEAKRLILAVNEERQYIPSENKQHEIWSRIQQSIEEESLSGEQVSSRFQPYRIAAIVALVIAAAGTLWWFAGSNRTTTPALATTKNDLIKEFNNSSSPKTIVLGDGSSIILGSQSSIEFPKIFGGNAREVQLTGEAFFEVAKDPKRPFIVRADKLITKVLGTSFTIRAFQNESNFSVMVKTGKVSVYAERDSEKKDDKDNAQVEGVLLTPNQQVVFIREESRLVKSLVENPALLSTSHEVNFEFKDTPLRDVFALLEQAYGIDIIYDEDVMQHCALNASLVDMPLYDKLRLICKGVNARYEILDSHIVITGKGCN